MKKIDEKMKCIIAGFKNNFEVMPVVILSIILNFTNLSIEGFANEYYSAGVKSMTMNLKNFFFVSFDPASFVSIDKPPIGFWVQAICAKLFGFSGFSVIFPQALAGVISVILIYFIVKRSFGKLAGIISSLCLAVTPIFVAASRNNTIDNLLVLSSLLACMFISLAADKGSIKYLLISFSLVGLGFNIKMLQAFMIVPALYITYICSSKITTKKKLMHIIIGTIVLISVSLSWTVIVDLVPKNHRPYVGSSSNDTVRQLIIGHNGTERLKLGISNTSDTGTGLLRLFSNNTLSDQISWLLVLAFLGTIAAVIQLRLTKSVDNKQKLDLILWIACLLPQCIYFSFERQLYHSYYLTMMSFSIAALCGIGVVSMWRLYNKMEMISLFLPITFMVNGSIELLLLSYYLKNQIATIVYFASAIFIFIPSIALISILIINKKKREFKINIVNFKKVIFYIAILGILIAPTVWAFTPMFYRMDGSSPMAGLRLIQATSKRTTNEKQQIHTENNTEKLINFLYSREKNEKYFLAVATAPDAAEIIVKTGREVMPIGGYNGRDKIISLDEFKNLIKEGEVKYAMIGQSYKWNSDIEDWIKKYGEKIPKEQWAAEGKNKKLVAGRKNKSINLHKNTHGAEENELYELDHC